MDEKTPASKETGAFEMFKILREGGARSMAGMTSSFKKYREQKKSASLEADLKFRIWIRTE